MEGRRGNDELGLTLSLFPGNSYGCGLQSKFSSESSTSPGALPLPLEFSSERNPATYGDEGTHFLKRIDVNRLPKRDGSGYEDEEEDTVAASSSPSSTVSSHSLSATKRGAEADLSEEDRISSRERNAAGRDEEDSSRKKLRLSKDQSALLEESFKQHPTLNPKQKMSLAKLLSLRPRQVEVWFQNRRARTKLKQTEVDCEFLKRCCENLTAENRRLQRELQELRALKMSPQFYMPVPATTLTMCPSCDKFGATAGAPAVRPMRFQVLDMPSRT